MDEDGGVTAMDHPDAPLPPVGGTGPLGINERGQIVGVLGKGSRRRGASFRSKKEVSMILANSTRLRCCRMVVVVAVVIFAALALARAMPAWAPAHRHPLRPRHALRGSSWISAGMSLRLAAFCWTRVSSPRSMRRAPRSPYPSPLTTVARSWVPTSMPADHRRRIHARVSLRRRRLHHNRRPGALGNRARRHQQSGRDRGCLPRCRGNHPGLSAGQER